MANTEAAPSSTKTWRLTLYELNRTPQEVISTDTEIKVSPRSLHSELMCPICLDMLKNTMTTKECLHRFCQECITTALRSGNKECPTCRKKLVSRRSLRADPTFDALIAKIYPNRAEYEAHQERVLAKLNKHHSTNALMNSIEEGMKFQNLIRSNNKARTYKRTAESLTAITAGGESIGDFDSRSTGMSYKFGSSIPKTLACEEPGRRGDKPHLAEDETIKCPITCTPTSPSRPQKNNCQTLSSGLSGTNSPAPSHDGVNTPPASKRGRSSAATAASSSAPSTSEAPPICEIELVFYPRPDSESANVDKKYIKTTDNATIQHLRRYLSMRVPASSDKSDDSSDSAKDEMFTLSLQLDGTVFTDLQPSMTLRQVYTKMWKHRKPLELFFTRNCSTVANTSQGQTET